MDLDDWWFSMFLVLCLVSEPEIYNSGTMQSGSTTYFVLNLIGEGCYGKVARCQNLQTKEEVAVKILKPDSAEDIKEEVGSQLDCLDILQRLGESWCTEWTRAMCFLSKGRHVGADQ